METVKSWTRDHIHFWRGNSASNCQKHFAHSSPNLHNIFFGSPDFPHGLWICLGKCWTRKNDVLESMFPLTAPSFHARCSCCLQRPPWAAWPVPRNSRQQGASPVGHGHSLDLEVQNARARVSVLHFAKWNCWKAALDNQHSSCTSLHSSIQQRVPNPSTSMPPMVYGCFLSWLGIEINNRKRSCWRQVSKPWGRIQILFR